MTKETLGQMIINGTDNWYRIAKTILKEDVDCEDAVSEAILKAFSKLHTLKKDKYAKTWFTKIIINECYQLLRDKNKESLYDSEIPEQQTSADHSELYQHMMEISEDYRIPIILYYIEGFNIQEIADMLDLKEVNVRKRLSRGRAMLRKLFGKQEAI